MQSLSDIAPSALARISELGEGLDITLSARPESGTLTVSDVWNLGGWNIQFVSLGAGEKLGLDQAQGKVYVKIITGALANTNQDRFAAYKQVRDTRVDDDYVEAAGDGALLAIFTETAAVGDNVRSMDELGVTGPHSEIMFWTRFDKSVIGKTIDYFKGLDAHLLPGFHLLDEDGTHIIYVHFWTAGKGVDMSPHDHSHGPSEAFPAFAETHWVLNNGTGRGGMYDCEDGDLNKRKEIPLQRGEDHGPFWAIDRATRMPKLRENGAVEYGFHGWQAGTDDDESLAYDLVAAFEMNPEFAKI